MIMIMTKIAPNTVQDHFHGSIRNLFIISYLQVLVISYSYLAKCMITTQIFTALGPRTSRWPSKEKLNRIQFKFMMLLCHQIAMKMTKDWVPNFMFYLIEMINFFTMFFSQEFIKVKSKIGKRTHKMESNLKNSCKEMRSNCQLPKKKQKVSAVLGPTLLIKESKIFNSSTT